MAHGLNDWSDDPPLRLLPRTYYLRSHIVEDSGPDGPALAPPGGDLFYWHIGIVKNEERLRINYSHLSALWVKVP